MMNLLLGFTAGDLLLTGPYWKDSVKKNDVSIRLLVVIDEM